MPMNMSFDPVSLALNGASLLGGLFGKKRKHIDPEYLRQHFGSRAIANDTQELANHILNSPYGQQLLSTAATSGQNFQTSMAAKAAASGLDPSSGGQAGAGDFATSAGAQAQNTMERGVKSDIYQQAMPIAAAQNEALRNAYLEDFRGNGSPSAGASTWQGIGNAAGFAASQRGPGQTGGTVPVGQSAFDVASAAVGPAQGGPQPGIIKPAGANVAVAPAGNGMIGMAAPVPNAAQAGMVAGAEPSPLSRRLGARRLAMSRAMVGQGAVRPYAMS